MLKHYIAAMLVSASALGFASAANAQEDQTHVSAARQAAIHECGVQSQRYNELTFNSLEYEVYRACMARHGQIE